MANYGIKVSQTGYPVLTATKAQLVFSTSAYPFKIVEEFSGSLTVTYGEYYDWSAHEITYAIHGGVKYFVVGFAKIIDSDNSSIPNGTEYAFLPAEKFPDTSGGVFSLYGIATCLYYRTGGVNYAMFGHFKPGYGSYYYTWSYKLLVLAEAGAP